MSDQRDRTIAGPARKIVVTLEAGKYFDIVAMERLYHVTAFGSAGSGNGNLNLPYGIAVAVDGSEVWVADSANSRIARFLAAGTWQSNIGSAGSGNGQFSSPRDVAIGSNGYGYVADYGNHRVQRITYSTQTYDSQWSTGALSYPMGIWYDEYRSRVLVALNGAQTLAIYSVAGVLQSTWTLGFAPVDVCSSPDGENVFITSTTQVFKYSYTGTYQGNVANSSLAATGRKYIHMDSAGQLYTADVGLQSVVKTLRDGQYISAHFLEGTGDLQFTDPSGIVRYQEFVYVVDQGNSRVVKARGTNAGNGVVCRFDSYGNVQITGQVGVSDVTSIG